MEHFSLERMKELAFQFDGDLRASLFDQEIDVQSIKIIFEVDTMKEKYGIVKE